VTAAALLGGPFNGARVELTTTPPRIVVDGSAVYVRVDDPDTGDFLVGYAHDVTGTLSLCTGANRTATPSRRTP